MRQEPALSTQNAKLNRIPIAFFMKNKKKSPLIPGFHANISLAFSIRLLTQQTTALRSIFS